jgi:hypothetical protein
MLKKLTDWLIRRPLDRLVGRPRGYRIGDRVSVPCRFGETGTIIEAKDGQYGIEFHNLEFTLWYDADELRPQAGKGFHWFREPNK